MPHNNWLEHAHFHGPYAEWLERVDNLCEHFLDIAFADIKDHGDFDTNDAFFVQGCRPEQFFKHIIVPYMECEHGFEFINMHIGDKVMWGISAPWPIE